MKVTCKAKLPNGKRCTAPPRLDGYCTKHYISRNYTRRGKVKKRGKKTKR